MTVLVAPITPNGKSEKVASRRDAKLGVRFVKTPKNGMEAEVRAFGGGGIVWRNAILTEAFMSSPMNYQASMGHYSIPIGRLFEGKAIAEEATVNFGTEPGNGQHACDRSQYCILIARAC